MGQQATSEAIQAQEQAQQNIGEVVTRGQETANQESTSQNLARGFAQMTARAASETSEPVQEQSQGEAAEAAASEPTAGDKSVEGVKKGEALSPEERQRRAEQSAGDRARHQQELEAQQAAQEQARLDAEQRRRAMLDLDDELLGQEARRQMQTQAYREQVLAEVVPHLEAKVHQDTRVLMASEMIETLDDPELKNRVVSSSDQWQSPTDFYKSYNSVVSERAIKEFREKELPTLLEEARQAGRHEAEAEWETQPLPQPDGGVAPSRQFRNTGDSLQAGLQQMRRGI